MCFTFVSDDSPGRSDGLEYQTAGICYPDATKLHISTSLFTILFLEMPHHSRFLPKLREADVDHSRILRSAAKNPWAMQLCAKPSLE